MMGVTHLEQLMTDELFRSMGKHAPEEQLDFGFPKLPRPAVFFTELEKYRMLVPDNILVNLSPIRVTDVAEHDPIQLGLFDTIDGATVYTGTTIGGFIVAGSGLSSFRVISPSHMVTIKAEPELTKWQRVRNWIALNFDELLNCGMSFTFTACLVMKSLDGKFHEFFWITMANLMFIQACHYRRRYLNSFYANAR